MASRGFSLPVLGLGPIVLTACVETGAATAQSTSAVPVVGIDLGNSARVPQIAGLAGEGEGYGRTEAGTTPTAHDSMPGMSHETGIRAERLASDLTGNPHLCFRQKPHDRDREHGQNKAGRGELLPFMPP